MRPAELPAAQTVRIHHAQNRAQGHHNSRHHKERQGHHERGGQVLVLTVQNQRQQGARNTRDQTDCNSLRAHEQVQGVRVATAQRTQRMLLIVAHQVR